MFGCPGVYLLSRRPCSALEQLDLAASLSEWSRAVSASQSRRRVLEGGREGGSEGLGSGRLASRENERAQSCALRPRCCAVLEKEMNFAGRLCFLAQPSELGGAGIEAGGGGSSRPLLRNGSRPPGAPRKSGDARAETRQEASADSMSSRGRNMNENSRCPEMFMMLHESGNFQKRFRPCFRGGTKRSLMRMRRWRRARALGERARRQRRGSGQSQPGGEALVRGGSQPRGRGDGRGAGGGEGRHGRRCAWGRLAG